MNAFIGLLFLCGTYSAYSASLSGITISAPCGGKQDGALLPVLGECSQFYICLEGREILQSCGVQQHYDNATQRCVEESKSLCVNGKWPMNSEHSEPPESKVEQPEEPKESIAPTTICTGKAIGSFVPSRTSCSEFYVCVGSRPMVKTCQEGLHFDPDTRACISAETSKCVVKVAEVKPVKPQLTGPIAADIFAETVCLGQANGAKFSAPGSCSKYFACLQEKSYEKSCGLRHFDPLVRSCVDANTSDCVEGGVIEAIVVDGEENAIPAEKENQNQNQNNIASTDLGTSTKYIVSGGKLIGNNRTIPIKQTGLPVNKATIKVDVVEVSMDNNGKMNAIDNGVDIGVVDENQRAGNSGIFIGSGNIDINNEGQVSDTILINSHSNGEVSDEVEIADESQRAGNSGVFVGSGNIDINNEGSVADTVLINNYANSDVEIADENQRAGNKGVFIGSGNVDINNEGQVTDTVVINNLSIAEVASEVEIAGESQRAGNKGVFIGSGNVDVNNEGQVSNVNLINNRPTSAQENVKAPVEEVSAENNNNEIVLAVVDETSAEQCVGVASGTLLPRFGNCREFITCEAGVAFVGQCPRGLHFNAMAKLCDWPEFAGCAANLN